MWPGRNADSDLIAERIARWSNVDGDSTDDDGDACNNNAGDGAGRNDDSVRDDSYTDDSVRSDRGDHDGGDRELGPRGRLPRNTK
jgi:hypothetical protein